MTTGQYPKRRESEQQAQKRADDNMGAIKPKEKFVPIEQRENRDLSKHSKL